MVVAILCCLPCIRSDTRDNCVDSVYESLDVDNKSVYPFKKCEEYWFHQKKKYESPELLSTIIDPPEKVIVAT